MFGPTCAKVEGWPQAIQQNGVDGVVKAAHAREKAAQQFPQPPRGGDLRSHRAARPQRPRPRAWLPDCTSPHKGSLALATRTVQCRTNSVGRTGTVQGHPAESPPRPSSATFGTRSTSWGTRHGRGPTCRNPRRVKPSSNPGHQSLAVKSETLDEKAVSESDSLCGGQSRLHPPPVGRRGGQPNPAPQEAPDLDVRLPSDCVTQNADVATRRKSDLCAA
jgi:hypothetical protein